MKHIKLYSILIVLCLTLSYVTLEFVFAKYYSGSKIGNINLTVTPRPQYELSGSDHDVIVEKNTQDEIVVSMIPGSGIHERIYIPLDTIEIGLYQLSFDVVMDSEYTDNLTVDNTKYIYGCTVGDNDTLELGDGAFMWKSITPRTKEHVDLAFFTTDEDVQNGNISWVWNWGNIRDNYRSRIFLTNIEVKKIEKPTAPYIDFPNTRILYLDTDVTNGTASNEWTEKETINYGQNTYHPAKGTFVTRATYNDIDVKVEGLAYCESFNIPIKGLTIGKTYKIKYDQRRGDANFLDLAVQPNVSYGSLVRESIHLHHSTLTPSMLQTFGPDEQETKDNEITFTATAENMYWIWESSIFSDNQWVLIEIENAVISEVV